MQVFVFDRGAGAEETCLARADRRIMLQLLLSDHVVNRLSVIRLCSSASYQLVTIVVRKRDRSKWCHVAYMKRNWLLDNRPRRAVNMCPKWLELLIQFLTRLSFSRRQLRDRKLGYRDAFCSRYLQGRIHGRVNRRPHLNSTHIDLYIGSRMFETSQRAVFRDAWKIPNIVFGRWLPEMGKLHHHL